MRYSRNCFWLILMLWSWPTFTQDIKFYATTDAKEVVVGSYMEVTFTLENAEGSNFVPPDFGGAKILNGPNRSSQMSIINGVVSRKMGISYSILASKQGIIRIGPASIVAQGKTFQSNNLEIKVLPAKENLKGGQEASAMYIRLETNDSLAYIGQQITLKYVLYASVNVHSYDFINESSYEGFFVNRIRNYQDRQERIVIDGVPYVRRTLKTLALFPQQTGSFKIDPALISIGIPEKNAAGSFFFTTRVRKEKLISNAGEITILSGPENPPENYSGAVGKFRMTANLDRRTATTDDAITIRMNISGDGDAKFLLPPKQNFSKDFDVYDPNLILENSFERGDKIWSEKQYEYLILPKTPGKYSLRPEFSYFDTDSLRFFELSSGPFEVQIIKGGKNASLKNWKEEVPSQLAPIMGVQSYAEYKNDFMYSTLFWVFLSLPLFLLLTFIVYRYYLVYKSSLDPEYLKSKSANKIAKERLNKAKLAMDNANNLTFYESINMGLFGYIGDKLGISPADLNRDLIKSYMRKNDIPEKWIDEFFTLINQCQMALYASSSPMVKEKLYENSLQLITNLEAHLK